MALAATYDFSMDQGADLDRTGKVFTWRDTDEDPVNLTGWTARMKIMKSLSADAVLLELTTENGGIVLGGIAGTITIKITDAQSALLTPATLRYILEMIDPSGYVDRLLQGTLDNRPEGPH